MAISCCRPSETACKKIGGRISLGPLLTALGLKLLVRWRTPRPLARFTVRGPKLRVPNMAHTDAKPTWQKYSQAG